MYCCDTYVATNSVCIVVIHMSLPTVYVLLWHICRYQHCMYCCDTYVATNIVCIVVTHMSLPTVYVLLWHICRYQQCMYCCDTYVATNIVCIVVTHMSLPTLYVLLWHICRYQQCHTLFGVHVKWPIFLLNFNQICLLSTDLHKSYQHQISRKSIQCKLRRYMRADEQTWSV